MPDLFLPATVTVRRYLAFFLALLLAATVLVIAAAAPARAAIVRDHFEGVVYYVDTDAPGAGATVERYIGTADEVVIPATVSIGGTDYPVTTIGNSAFEDPFRAPLTSVSLPDTIVTIGRGAFFHARLTSLTLPDSIVTIDQSAFEFNYFTSVTLPRSLVNLGDNAFGGNHDLTQVQFTGPAPSAIAGADTENPSLGTAAGLTVTFPAHLAQSSQQGYTTPEWLGYRANAFGYAVSFDTSGGADIEPVTIVDGAFVELPSVPVREGYSFTGWYTSSELDIRFDPSVPVTESLTLFAGWKQNSYTVSFDSGGGAVVDPVSVSHGAVVELPEPPVREGYTFTGWFATPELDVALDAELPVTEDMTVFAGWRQNTVPVEPVTPDWDSLFTGSLGILALASTGA